MVEKEMMVKIQNVTEGPEKYVVARYFSAFHGDFFFE